MYKTLGGYSWTDLFINATSNATNTVQSLKEPNKIPITVTVDEFGAEETVPLDKTILDSAKELQSSFHGLKAVNYQNMIVFMKQWLSVKFCLLTYGNFQEMFNQLI